MSTDEFTELEQEALVGRARIAELEAENARLKARDTPYKLIHPDHLAGLDVRIAELEAERDEAWNTGYTEGYNEAYERYGRSVSMGEAAARIAELEDELAGAAIATAHAQQGQRALFARIAELEAELKLERDASRQAMLVATQRFVAAEVRIAELEAELRSDGGGDAIRARPAP